MPSVIPGQIFSAANTPGSTSQYGCVECLREGEVGPLEIVYNLGGYSLCMRHARDVLTSKGTQ